jgi:hypothetical protein
MRACESGSGDGERLFLENSTVCLIVNAKIPCLACWLRRSVWLVCWGRLIWYESENASFRFVALINRVCLSWWVRRMVVDHRSFGGGG